MMNYNLDMVIFLVFILCFVFTLIALPYYLSTLGWIIDTIIILIIYRVSKYIVSKYIVIGG